MTDGINAGIPNTSYAFYEKLDHAVHFGEWSEVAALINAEPNHNDEDAQAYAFEQAIEYSNMDIIQHLIKEKAVIQPHYLTRAAYLCSADPHLFLGGDMVLDLLLKNGAKPSNDPRILDIAIRKNAVKLINKLTHVDHDLVASCKTCIETVARTGSRAILDMLLTRGGDKHITFTAFEKALEYGKFEIMDRLYEVAQQNNLKTDFIGKLLHNAATHSNVEGVNYLLAKPDCTQKDKDLALKEAVHCYADIERVQATNLHQYPEMINLLINKGATFKLTNKRDILDLPFKMTDNLKNDLKDLSERQKRLKP
jgi:hypothetical protein